MVELSVVMPCLNEADTLEVCIRKAQKAIDGAGISGEIIVADNGSTDGSQDIAMRCGATVVDVPERGYGSALMGGITAARGKYIMMGDADDSYDWAEIPRFVERLREGNDLVQGCRLPSGGGTVLPGAMPFLHRWLGNPVFSKMARWWFGAPIHDIHCGMRGFTRSMYDRLDMRCLGMEFAAEMIIKASLRQEAISEVPITLHPDGRKAHAPHLRTFRDGWRTLRFFLLYSPRWLFLIPGVAMIVFGLLGYVLALPRLELFGLNFDAHTLLFSSLAILCGFQSVIFAILSKVYAVSEGLVPSDEAFERIFDWVNLERGLAASAIAVITGAVFLGVVVVTWSGTGFGDLDYTQTMRWAVVGATAIALGFQLALSSFFASLLGMKRL